QRLGRNAAPVQANAAEVGFFHDRGLEAELCGANGGDVAAGTGADDDDVEGCVGHFQSLSNPRCNRVASPSTHTKQRPNPIRSTSTRFQIPARSTLAHEEWR